MDKKFLIFVDVKDGTQSNKYYNMEQTSANSFTATYGRVGASKTVHTYPMSKWNQKYRDKLRKGYKDVTDLKQVTQVVSSMSDNKDFNDFYNVFQKYTGSTVSKNYLIDSCTPQQLQEAQHILDEIVKLSKKDKFKKDKINANLLELYKVIPRRMDNVRDYLIEDPKQLTKMIVREQDGLDSMDSSNITHTVNPFDTLNIDFQEVTTPPAIAKLINNTSNGRARIYKTFRVTDKDRVQVFTDWVNSQKNNFCQYLIHGTRNANVFSILKSGLLVRPSNAASFAGSAYGDGIYHSAHAAKSLNYVGYDTDKIFFIQNVHMGNHYTYSGWYRQGKDLSRSQMNYKDLKSLGYDSLFVKPGDGLLNSEYIVYRFEQTITNYLVWLK